jgi:DNA-directed RNA polymerase subunit RPC12/RpoP
MVLGWGVNAGELPRNTCMKCDTEYDGIACPACGLKFRPRCPDCGSRLAWSKTVTSCLQCGCPTPETVFFTKIEKSEE